MTENYPDRPLRLIAAIGKSRQIGAGNALLWHIPEDLKFFKQETMGGAIIMGRKTWESIGRRRLPGRLSIVVSRQPAPTDLTIWKSPKLGDLIWATDLAEALTIAREADSVLATGTPYIIGGGEIYRQALPLATELLLTEVDLDPPADTFFPSFDPRQWMEIDAKDLSQNPKARFRHLIRKAQGPVTA